MTLVSTLLTFLPWKTWVSNLRESQMFQILFALTHHRFTNWLFPDTTSSVLTPRPPLPPQIDECWNKVHWDALDTESKVVSIMVYSDVFQAHLYTLWIFVCVSAYMPLCRWYANWIKTLKRNILLLRNNENQNAILRK